jgi:hypothetical protein
LTLDCDKPPLRGPQSRKPPALPGDGYWIKHCVADARTGPDAESGDLFRENGEVRARERPEGNRPDIPLVTGEAWADLVQVAAQSLALSGRDAHRAGVPRPPRAGRGFSQDVLIEVIARALRENRNTYSCARVKRSVTLSGMGFFLAQMTS